MVSEIQSARRCFAMSITELRSAAHALPRRDKFLLAQQLLAELAEEEAVSPIEHPIFSPLEAHAAAAVLSRVLEEEKARTAWMGCSFSLPGSQPRSTWNHSDSHAADRPFTSQTARRGQRPSRSNQPFAVSLRLPFLRQRTHRLRRPRMTTEPTILTTATASRRAHSCGV
jgi:hypothetical protein